MSSLELDGEWEPACCISTEAVARPLENSHKQRRTAVYCRRSAGGGGVHNREGKHCHDLLSELALQTDKSVCKKSVNICETTVTSSSLGSDGGIITSGSSIEQHHSAGESKALALLSPKLSSDILELNGVAGNDDRQQPREEQAMTMSWSLRVPLSATCDGGHWQIENGDVEVNSIATCEHNEETSINQRRHQDPRKHHPITSDDDIPAISNSETSSIPGVGSETLGMKSAPEEDEFVKLLTANDELHGDIHSGGKETLTSQLAVSVTLAAVDDNMTFDLGEVKNEAPCVGARIVSAADELKLRKIPKKDSSKKRRRIPVMSSGAASGVARRISSTRVKTSKFSSPAKTLVVVSSGNSRPHSSLQFLPHSVIESSQASTVSLERSDDEEGECLDISVATGAPESRAKQFPTIRHYAVRIPGLGGRADVDSSGDFALSPDTTTTVRVSDSFARRSSAPDDDQRDNKAGNQDQSSREQEVRNDSNDLPLNSRQQPNLLLLPPERYVESTTERRCSSRALSLCSEPCLQGTRRRRYGLLLRRESKSRFVTLKAVTASSAMAQSGRGRHDVRIGNNSSSVLFILHQVKKTRRDMLVRLNDKTMLPANFDPSTAVSGQQPQSRLSAKTPKILPACHAAPDRHHHDGQLRVAETAAGLDVGQFATPDPFLSLGRHMDLAGVEGRQRLVSLSSVRLGDIPFHNSHNRMQRGEIMSLAKSRRHGDSSQQKSLENHWAGALPLRPARSRFFSTCSAEAAQSFVKMPQFRPPFASSQRSASVAVAENRLSSSIDLTPPARFLLQVDSVLRAILSRITPSVEERHLKQAAFNALASFLRMWMGDQIKLFVAGSSAYDVDSYASDLDVVITTTVDINRLDVLQRLSCILEESHKRPDKFQLKGPLMHFKQQLVESARVPILLLKSSQGVVCDVSVNTGNSLCHTEFFKRVLREKPQLRALMRLVKFWVKSRKLPTTREGGLPSIVWMLLCVFTCRQSEVCYSKPMGAVDASNDIARSSNYPRVSRAEESSEVSAPTAMRFIDRPPGRLNEEARDMLSSPPIANSQGMLYSNSPSERHPGGRNTTADLKKFSSDFTHWLWSLNLTPSDTNQVAPYTILFSEFFSRLSSRSALTRTLSLAAGLSIPKSLQDVSRRVISPPYHGGVWDELLSVEDPAHYDRSFFPDALLVPAGNLVTRPLSAPSVASNGVPTPGFADLAAKVSAATWILYQFELRRAASIVQQMVRRFESSCSSKRTTSPRGGDPNADVDFLVGLFSTLFENVPSARYSVPASLTSHTKEATESTSSPPHPRGRQQEERTRLGEHASPNRTATASPESLRDEPSPPLPFALILLSGKLLIVRLTRICADTGGWWSREFLSRRDIRSVMHGIPYHCITIPEPLIREEVSAASADWTKLENHHQHRWLLCPNPYFRCIVNWVQTANFPIGNNSDPLIRSLSRVMPNECNKDWSACDVRAAFPESLEDSQQTLFNPCNVVCFFHGTQLDDVFVELLPEEVYIVTQSLDIAEGSPFWFRNAQPLMSSFGDLQPPVARCRHCQLRGRECIPDTLGLPHMPLEWPRSLTMRVGQLSYFDQDQLQSLGLGSPNSDTMDLLTRLVFGRLPTARWNASTLPQLLTPVSIICHRPADSAVIRELAIAEIARVLSGGTPGPPEIPSRSIVTPFMTPVMVQHVPRRYPSENIFEAASARQMAPLQLPSHWESAVSSDVPPPVSRVLTQHPRSPRPLHGLPVSSNAPGVSAPQYLASSAPPFFPDMRHMQFSQLRHSVRADMPLYPSSPLGGPVVSYNRYSSYRGSGATVFPTNYSPHPTCSSIPVHDGLAMTEVGLVSSRTHMQIVGIPVTHVPVAPTPISLAPSTSMRPLFHGASEQSGRRRPSSSFSHPDHNSTLLPPAASPYAVSVPLVQTFSSSNTDGILEQTAYYSVPAPPGFSSIRRSNDKIPAEYRASPQSSRSTPEEKDDTSQQSQREMLSLDADDDDGHRVSTSGHDYHTVESCSTKNDHISSPQYGSPLDSSSPFLKHSTSAESTSKSSIDHVSSLILIPSEDTSRDAAAPHPVETDDEDLENNDLDHSNIPSNVITRACHVSTSSPQSIVHHISSDKQQQMQAASLSHLHDVASEGGRILSAARVPNKRRSDLIRYVPPSQREGGSSSSIGQDSAVVFPHSTSIRHQQSDTSQMIAKADPSHNGASGVCGDLSPTSSPPTSAWRYPDETGSGAVVVFQDPSSKRSTGGDSGGLISSPRTDDLMRTYRDFERCDPRRSNRHKNKSNNFDRSRGGGREFNDEERPRLRSHFYGQSDVVRQHPRRHHQDEDVNRNSVPSRPNRRHDNRQVHVHDNADNSFVSYQGTLRSSQEVQFDRHADNRHFGPKFIQNSNERAFPAGRQQESPSELRGLISSPSAAS